jgi:PAS domain S-box-containing protein
MKQPEKLRRLVRRYSTTLRKYAAEEREAVLETAYELGRAAIGDGLGILDLARMHRESREKLLRADTGGKNRERISKAAATFFLQALSPFEATHRGFCETNAELQKRNRELEAEMAERRRAEKALHASEARLRAILDHSPAIIFLKDAQGRYLHVNRQFERQFGLDRSQVIGRTDRDIFPREQASHFQNHDREVLDGGVPLEFEEAAHYRDGIHTSIVSKFPLRDVKGKVYALCGIATDITVRKRVEEALRLSEERFRLLVSSVRNYAVFLLRPDGRVASWNPGAERIKGYRENEIVGRNFSCFYLPREARDGRPQRGLKIARRQGRFEDEGWRVRKDGTLFWANVVITPVRDDSGRLRWFAKVVQDLTERKRFEESLQNLSRKILHAQEDERRRVSRELHDEVGQSLTAISVTLASLRNNGAMGSEHFSRTIVGTQRLLEGTMETVHRFARELRPAMLDELGLLPALRSHVKNFSERTGLEVGFHADSAAEKLNGEQKTTIFRVAQESLTNVAKHAHASRVKVFLRRVSGGICLEIADNGKSFRTDPATAARQKQRLGLLGMQERVRLVNGRFEIEPEPGRGTIVRVTIPFSEHGHETLTRKGGIYGKDSSVAG